MKKSIAVLFVLSLAVSFTACSTTSVSETDEVYQIENVDITKVKRPKKEEAESES